MMSPTKGKKQASRQNIPTLAPSNSPSPTRKSKRPGGSRSPTKPPTASMPRPKTRQTTVTSASPCPEPLPTTRNTHTFPPKTTTTTTTKTFPTKSTPQIPPRSSITTSSSSTTSLNPTNDTLLAARAYLRDKSPSSDPGFLPTFTEIKGFVEHLSRSEEVFDRGLLKDVGCMLRVHGERMNERWEGEIDGEEEEEDENDDDNGEGRVVTYKVPSWNTTESSGFDGRLGVTYKVPSWSTTESSGRSGILPGGMFTAGGGEDNIVAPNRHHDHGATSQRRSTEEEAEFYGLDEEELEDAHPIQFSKSLLEKAEKQMHDLDRESSARKRGKRPFMEDVDTRYANKRARKGSSTISGPTSAEIRFIEGKPYFPLEEHDFMGMDDVVEEEEKGKEEEDSEADGEEQLGDDTPRASQRDARRPQLSGKSPKLGSGSLMPPEIANFDLDITKGKRKSTATTEKTTNEGIKEDSKIETQFWPGDPVFMFGETKFLQAVKSRQIEKDLAPNDEEVQAEIDRRPLFGMFARFELPDVSKGVEEEPKPRSFCVVS